MIAFSPDSVFYLSGAAILTQRLLPERLAIVAVRADGDPAFIVCNIEQDLAKKHSSIGDIRIYVEFEKSPIDVLLECLRGWGIRNASVGLEMSFLTAAFYRRLQEGAIADRIRFDDCSDLIGTLRMTKDREELDTLERANQATDRAIRSAFEAARIGDTERQLGFRISEHLQANGADQVGWVLVGFGETSHLVHQLPTDKQMKAGDLVRIDCGGSFGGYYSDLARSCFAGQPTPRQRSIYDRLLEGHDRIIEGMRPGVRPCDVFRNAVHVSQELGIPMREKEPHCGHSIGLSIHERPILNPFETMELRPGMVFCVEPTYFAATGEFFHTEDLVVITETGSRVVSRSVNWRQPYTIGG